MCGSTSTTLLSIITSIICLFPLTVYIIGAILSCNCSIWLSFIHQICPCQNHQGFDKSQAGHQDWEKKLLGQGPTVPSISLTLCFKASALHAKDPSLHATALHTSSPTVRTRDPTLHTSSPTVHARDPTLHTSSLTVHARNPTLHTSSPTTCVRDPTLHTSGPTISFSFDLQSSKDGSSAACRYSVKAVPGGPKL